MAIIHKCFLLIFPEGLRHKQHGYGCWTGRDSRSSFSLFFKRMVHIQAKMGAFAAFTTNINGVLFFTIELRTFTFINIAEGQSVLCWSHQK